MRIQQLLPSFRPVRTSRWALRLLCAFTLPLVATTSAHADGGGLIVSAEDAAFAPPTLSWIGAETLAQGESAMIVSAGLPDLEVAYPQGISSIADAAGRLRFQYGRGVRIGGGGVTLGATLRLRLAESAGWSIALVSEPEVVLHVLGHDHPPTNNNGATAFGLTPLAGGLTISREIVPDVRLAVSVATAVGFFVTPEMVLSVPLTAGIGAEAKLTPTTWLFAKLDSGFDFYGPGGLPGSQAFLRARLGLSWLR